MVNIHDYDAYCFDLDGTIYVGDQLLPGVKETIEKIRSHKKKILAITNSSTLTREACKERLGKFGLCFHLEEIITALYLTVRFIREQLPDARVLVVGETSIVDELNRHSINTTNEPKEASHVLVGFDSMFSYQKIQMSMDAIRRGAKLIVINPDPVCPVPGGYIPDTMSFAKAIETASGKPISQVIGKPSPYYGDSLLETLNVERNRCLVIGDRLETDIQLGTMNGFSTCLVLTGVSSRANAEKNEIKPDIMIESMDDLFV